MSRLRLCIVLVLSWAVNTATAEVKNFKVTTDKTIDTSSLESIVNDVIARSAR